MAFISPWRLSWNHSHWQNYPSPSLCPPCTQQRHGELSLPGECGADPQPLPLCLLPPLLSAPRVCRPRSLSPLLSLPSFSLSPSRRVQGPPFFASSLVSVSFSQTCSSLPGLSTPFPCFPMTRLSLVLSHPLPCTQLLRPPLSRCPSLHTSCPQLPGSPSEG